jgi:hypothetical protein
MHIEPFSVYISEGEVEGLQRRLHETPSLGKEGSMPTGFVNSHDTGRTVSTGERRSMRLTRNRSSPRKLRASGFILCIGGVSVPLLTPL